MENFFSVDIEGGDQVGKGDAVKNLSFQLANEGFDVSVKYELVHELDQGHGGYFSHYSRFETHKSFGIISPDHELVAQLREQRLDPFP